MPKKKDNEGRKRKLEALGIVENQFDRFLDSPTQYLREEYGIGKKKVRRRKKALPGDDIPSGRSKYEIIPDFCDDLFDSPSSSDSGLSK